MEYKLTANARCAVIGYGTWATALVGVLTNNEARVGWYVRNPEVLESLRTEGRNLRYLSDLEFDTERIAPSDDLNEVVANADIIIMAAPSAYLKTFLEPLTVSLKDKFIISAVKGIIPGDYKTVVEYLHDTGRHAFFRAVGSGCLYRTDQLVGVVIDCDGIGKGAANVNANANLHIVEPPC
jgi:glycerol-3-phosphate dehydrogenase (NAD(P)+)